jgi:biopolymer transport protein ExbD
MRYLLALALASTLGCTSGSTRGTCDERALDDALTHFEADPGADGAALELLDAMSSACPSYPFVLFRELDDYVRGDDDRVFLQPSPLYQFARRSICEDVDGWSAAFDLPGDERAPAVYQACGFERFGLLEPGEPFLFEDFIAMVTQHWMVDHGVDPGLAQRFNRSLMLATAPEPLSRRRCHAEPDSMACDTLLRAHGGRLPRSNVIGSTKSRTVFVTPSWLAVDGRDGIIDRQNFTDPPSPGPSTDEDESSGLRIVADARTPWSQMIELLQSARQRGFIELSLVVVNGDDIADLQIDVPVVWSGGQAPERPPVAFVVETDGVRVPDGSVVGLERLEDHTRALLSEAREPVEVVVRAGPAIELQAVVTVLDAIRGDDCWLQDRKNETCLVRVPTVDLDPPKPRRPGDWSRLQLRVDKISTEGWSPRDAPTTPKRVTAKVERALEPLRTCLLESELAREYVPEVVVLIFGRDHDDQLAVFVWASGPEWHNGRTWLPTECLARTLDLPQLDTRRMRQTAFVDITLAVELPE